MAVLAIPRCGSESLASGRHLMLDEVKQFDRRVAFVRDPFTNEGRIVSGFRFFAQFPKDPRYVPTYEAHVDRILNAQKGGEYLSQTKEGARIKTEPRIRVVDPHWLPQATLLAEAPIAVTEIYPLDQLSSLIKKLPEIRYHETDKSKPVALDYRLAELLAYYAADVALLKSFG